MRDIRKKSYMYYSQNSLNTFRNCPLKFKQKYMEGLNWKNDELKEKDYELKEKDYDESIEVGLKFHLMCERYFSGIDACECDDYELSLWYQRLKKLLPIDEKNIYLPEYEMRMKKGNIRIQAKYDLVIIKPQGEIEIWDWKTENRKLNLKELSGRIQTLVYMYALGEKGEGVLKKNVDLNKLTMKFWQPQFEESIINIDYSYEKHMANEEILKGIIDRLDEYDFEKDFNMELYKKHCGYCEFNVICRK